MGKTLNYGMDYNMKEEEFDKVISEIERLLYDESVKPVYEKMYREKRDYGKKVKIHNIKFLSVVDDIYYTVVNDENWRWFRNTGSVQIYTTNRNGKRSVIIKWFKEVAK
jgi:hypothetical protein